MYNNYGSFLDMVNDIILCFNSQKMLWATNNFIPFAKANNAPVLYTISYMYYDILVHAKVKSRDK